MNKKQQDITDRLFYETELQNTEAAVLFGCKSISGTLARQAYQLHKDGVFDKIIITGGQKVRQPMTFIWLLLTGKLFGVLKTTPIQDFFSKQTEAEYIYDVLVNELEMDPNKIIFQDNKSKNSGQNIENTLSVIHQFNSVSLISFAPMQRRSLGTLRFQQQDTLTAAQTIPVYAFGYDASNWFKSLFLKLLIIGPEYKKMKEGGSYIDKYAINPDLEKEQNHLRSLSL